MDILLNIGKCFWLVKLYEFGGVGGRFLLFLFKLLFLFSFNLGENIFGGFVMVGERIGEKF